MRSLIVALGLAAGLSTPAAAQQYSLIVSPDVSIQLRRTPANSAIGVVDDEESLIVTPDASAPYDARPFATFSTLNVLLGDVDNDSNLNNSSPLGDMNCMFVKNMPPHAQARVGVRDVYISSSATRNIATTSGLVQVDDGDVWRAANGQLEFFIRELAIRTALGDQGADVECDGIAQDVNGNLFFSLWATVTSTTLGTLDDGDVWYVSRQDIVYDQNGNVVMINQGSARLFATESDMDGIASSSGTLRADGTPVTRAGDTSGLNIDPNGGIWISPQDPTLFGANLIFNSNFAENFDNIWSTANGGSPAIINGVQMAYTQGPADGSKLGVALLPSGQDALNAMALVPATSDWIAMDSPSAGSSAQGVFTIEVGRVAPSTAIGLLIDFWGGDQPGGYVAGVPFPPGLLGGHDLFHTPGALIAFTISADANGYAVLGLPAPASLPAGLDLVMQSAGFSFIGGLSASGPGSLTF